MTLLNFRKFIMIQMENYWLFRDEYDQLWKITYIPDPTCPFRIELVEK